MANNQYVNKVIYNGNTIIDLTGVTVTEDKVAKDYTAHSASGAQITGTATDAQAETITKGFKTVLIIPTALGRVENGKLYLPERSEEE